MGFKLKAMTQKARFTTVALDPNQYLVFSFDNWGVEGFMIGYTNGKRDKKIDGWYLYADLKKIQ